MEQDRTDYTKAITIFFICITAAMFSVSFFCGGIDTLLTGYARFLTMPQALAVDPLAVMGLGGAAFSSALLACTAMLVFKLGKVRLGGSSIAAFFLMTGYGFFGGKNLINVWPLILGVWLYSKVKRESFSEHANIALFSTSLAPIVSEILFNRYIDMPLYFSIPLALVVGAMFGFVLDGFAAHALTMHKGFCLYNAGLSAGILATIFYAVYKNVILKPAGITYVPNSIFSAGEPVVFPILFGVMCTAILIAGIVINRGFSGYWQLLKRTGHKCDLVDLDGIGLVLINMGITGLMMLGCFLIIEVPFNGLECGALICSLCWTGSGANPFTLLPIIVGYGAVSLISGIPPNAELLPVAVCFAAGLAPISGHWGPHWGIIAGAVHACLVQSTSAFHGGFNIYNSGFTAGIVAMVMVPLLESLFDDMATRRTKRLKRLFAREINGESGNTAAKDREPEPDDQCDR